MKTKEFYKILEEICPKELAEEWDNSGPQISFDDDEIKNVLVALEVTYDVIKEAINRDVNLILTHHPVYFDGNSWITPLYTPGAYALELVKHRISVYSTHTNFDNLVGGNNDYFAKILGFDKISCPSGEGIYRLADIKPTTINDLIDDLCKAFGVKHSFVHLVGNPNQNVSRIGWCTGAGFDFIYDAYKEGAECYITGDVKYHDARDAHERGMNVIDIGHFGSEKIFAENMISLLEKNNCEVNIIKSESDIDPFYEF